MGIDPGIHGGIALVAGVTLINIAKLPTRQERKSNGDYRTLDDEWTLFEMMQDWAPDVIYCEDVYSMQDQGVVSVFTFGQGKGVIRGCAAGARRELRFVSPQKWKGQLGVMPPRYAGATDDQHKARLKALSINRAQTLFPEKAPSLTKDGPAEAALIAAYGVLHCRREGYQARADEDEDILE